MLQFSGVMLLPVQGHWFYSQRGC